MKPERLERITVEDGECGGRPCIRGYHIRVTDVLELLAAGARIEEILLEYPSWKPRTSTLRLSTPPDSPTTRF